MVKDPVCGMEIDESQAADSIEYEGKKYYFCSSHCKSSFEKEPEKYTQDDSSAGHHHHHH